MTMENLFTSNIKNIEEADRDEMLIAFSQSVEAGNGNAADWMQRHPAHADDIARFAADRWAAGSAPAHLAQSDASAAAIAAMGMDILRSLRPQTASVTQMAPVAVRPLTSLVAAAMAKGLDADEAAAALSIPQPLFVKLHRRLIALESVPRAFVSALAETIGRTADEVSAYLRQPPTLATGASFRADDTPTVGGQESFADALRQDPEATGIQRERWLS